MFASIKSASLRGIEASIVDVEAQVRGGIGKVSIIGLADSAIRESKDRVTCAIRASGIQFPKGVVLVNLAPASIKKEGSSFDLPIALSILAASKNIDKEATNGYLVCGELALNGALKPVEGAVAMAIEALRCGCHSVVVPMQNYHEASLIEGISVYGASTLQEVVELFTQGVVPQEPQDVLLSQSIQGLENSLTFNDVWGQQRAKKAMAIAAAGSHNMLMVGPPGCGKSLLASCMPSILPGLKKEELLEAVRIHSVAGSEIKSLLKGIRPFRAPHHVISQVGMIGGGSTPKPGEISLAHRGVLFLDEFPEYTRSVLEALRAPLESGKVSIVRASSAAEYPANFQLIAAMNPCPCGRLGVSKTSCTCSLPAIERYLSKLSEPILDRIDLHVEMEPIPFSVIHREQQVADISTKDTIDWKTEVAQSQEYQLQRQGRLNAGLSSEQLRVHAKVCDKGMSLLERASEKFGFSTRTSLRIVRVSRTIADFEEADKITPVHIAEAISFRHLERERRV